MEKRRSSTNLILFPGAAISGRGRGEGRGQGRRKGARGIREKAGETSQ